MNAIEFVKNYGIDSTREKIDFLENRSRNKSEAKDKFLIEIKQIVDAFELVESYGGLDGAKEILEIVESGFTAVPDVEIRNAINLVEKCQ